MSKQFLAVGDYLINPELLTFAVLEQGSAEPRLRLGFATHGAGQEGELRLTGDVAREVLRWLRLNAVFLSAGGGFGSTGSLGLQSSPPAESLNYERKGNGTIADSWGRVDVPRSEGAGKFLSRAGERS